MTDLTEQNTQPTQPTTPLQVTLPTQPVVANVVRKPVTVASPTAPSQPNEGGEKPVVKDPKGMFDYSNCQTYVVKKGDKLLDIALKYHVVLQQLRYFNHIDKATWSIRPGQVIYIPTEPVYVPVGK